MNSWLLRLLDCGSVNSLILLKKRGAMVLHMASREYSRTSICMLTLNAGESGRRHKAASRSELNRRRVRRDYRQRGSL
jgi:hypothetical protein